MKRHIKDIRRNILEDFDVDVSRERVRKFGAMGLYSSTRNSNLVREYSDTEYEKARMALLLLEIGVPHKYIKQNNYHKIDNRINSIDRILTELKRKRGTNGNIHSTAN